MLPRISTNAPGEYGSGDKRVQAYCYRYCVTDHPENRIPFPKPGGYDPKQYELLLRVYQAGWRETFDKFDPIPNRKTDSNNHGPFSTDNIGMNYDYPEASYERRRQILAEHRTYQQGWLWFIANDPRVPKDVQEKMRQWGLPRDEFKDNGNWPHQIYVREARRMIGQFVMTENELTKKKPTPDPVGMGSYTIDSHNVQRYITPEGYVQNEGDIGVGIAPYAIAYGALVPKKGQCDNLFVSICVSSSHIAFGSIRMEPVFMILGQSAATAAALAMDGNHAVQDVPYAQLRERLLRDGQVLEYASAAPGGQASNSANSFLDPKGLPGVVADDDDAQLIGDWKRSSATPGYVGHGYRHNENAKDGKASARFEAKLPKPGRYEVRLAYPPNSNRASNVKIEIQHASGTKSVAVNQRQPPPVGGMFISLGEFEFSGNSTVTILTAGADGYVVIDAVQWLAR